MLKELLIENFAVIQSLHINWKSGFNVITGETGAGKSIIINALKYILGAKMGSELIRKGEERLRIEAIFDISNNRPLGRILERLDVDSDGRELVIERTLANGGRNRCRVNGTLLPILQLEKIGRNLVDLHGQHSQQTLLNPNTHLRYIDAYGGYQEQLQAFKHIHFQWRQKLSEMDKLKEQAKATQEKKDFYRFQLEELNGARLLPDEDTILEEQLEISNNMEKITGALYNTQELLEGEPHGMLSLVHQLKSQIGILQNNTSAFTGVSEPLDAILSGLEDIQLSLRRFELPEKQSAESLDDLNSRLAFLQRLQSKYQTNIKGLIELRDNRKRALDQLTDFESDRRQLESDILDIYAQLIKHAQLLSESRKKAASKFTESVQSVFVKLGMERCKLSYQWRQFESQAFQADSMPPSGAESLVFLFIAGPQEKPRALQTIASGGEASRIMLAIKAVLAEADAVPVLVFDEIDTGVGGETANRIGEVMQDLAQSHQILTITHLHQIAALAGHHTKVHKSIKDGRFSAAVHSLDKNERVKELARMMGDSESASSVRHARTLLKETLNTLQTRY